MFRMILIKYHSNTSHHLSSDSILKENNKGFAVLVRWKNYFQQSTADLYQNSIYVAVFPMESFGFHWILVISLES